MDTDAGTLFWFLVPGFVIPTVLLVLAFRSPSQGQMQRWATDAGVALSPDNEALIRGHLGRARRWRSCAAFPFWWLASVPLLIGQRWPTAITSPFIGVAFYVVGGLLAELTTPTPAVGKQRATAFAPRRIADYLPGWARQAPWILLGLSALGIAIAIPAARRWEMSGDPTRAAVALGLGVAVALLAEAAARAVVARPQRTGNPSVLQADDALRCTAVSSANAAAMLAGLAVLLHATDALSPVSPSWWFVPLGLWQLALTGLSVGALALIVRQEMWAIARRPNLTVPAPT